MNNLSQYDAVRNNGVQSGQYNQRSYPPRHDNQRNYQDHRQIEQATRFNEYNKKETQSDAHRSFENTSSANRGNDGYGQGQEFRQTNGATEFKQMDNREDSSRYYGNQERRGSGYNYQRQENERRTENRGGYRANSRPNFETNFNQRQEHRSDSQHRFGNTLSANRGKDGFEQGQKFRPAQRDTELNRMNNREDSSRYYENQQRRGSGYDTLMQEAEQIQRIARIINDETLLFLIGKIDLVALLANRNEVDINSIIEIMDLPLIHVIVNRNVVNTTRKLDSYPTTNEDKITIQEAM
uniref:Translation initiation factor IF-2 n=1 Tax=Caenorhabditis tropicalis TaxID=1561998 RepID=A0A1I7URS1_9PELO